MPEFLLPLTLIHVHPLLADVKEAIRSSVFDRFSVRQQMNIVCSYLEFVCTPGNEFSTDTKYDYGLAVGAHVELIHYLRRYVSDLIADTSPVNLSSSQIENIRPRLLFKVTGTQALPVIIGVDSENLRDRELYDRHM